MQNRAKIFMPFDALKGFKKSLKREEEKHEKGYTSEIDIVNIINKFNILDMVEVNYFYNFEYINLIGQIKKIDYKKRYIIVSNSKIDFDDIDCIKNVH